MVKIQHGWDTHTLQELEEQHSRKIFPSANTRMRHSDSPQSYSRRRRNSATSDDGDIYLESPHSKSLNGTPNGTSNELIMRRIVIDRIRTIEFESGHQVSSCEPHSSITIRHGIASNSHCPGCQHSSSACPGSYNHLKKTTKIYYKSSTTFATVSSERRAESKRLRAKFRGPSDSTCWNFAYA